MKTLLAAINAKYIHSNPAVYSLQKSAALYSEQWNLPIGQVKIREFTINQNIETIYYEILAEKADVVAFSVYIWNLEIVNQLSQDLKQAFPELEIWLGGPEVSYGVQGKMLSEQSYDWIMEGEGEHVFFALLAEKCGHPSAEQREKLKAWGIEKCGRHIWAQPIENLDELPFIYDNMEPFQNRIIYYEASRGCPFMCAYCLSAAEQGVRELPLSRVLKELAYLVQQGVTQIKLVDRTFNCNAARAKAILQWIRELPAACPTNFHFEIEANLLADELVEEMLLLPKGRIQLEIGIQSTYAPALRACRRTDRLDRVFEHVRRLREPGTINVHVDLIAGLPLETYEIFKESFNTVYRLKAHQFQLGFLKLLTGAPMNELTEQYGYVFAKHPPYEILKNEFLTPQDLFRLKCIEDVLERLYNSGHFQRFLNLLEMQYETPFDMMQALAEHFWQKGRIFTAMGLTEVYQEAALFAESRQDSDALLKALLLDYYTATPSDRLPDRLKALTGELAARGGTKEERQRMNAFLKRLGMRERKIVLRAWKGQWAAIDYTMRDPVTEQYTLVGLEKSDC